MNKFWIEIVTTRMKEKRLSIRQLAIKSDTAPGFLARVLRGERNPPHDENLLCKIANILGFDSDYLIFAAGRIPDKYEKYFLDPNIVERLNRILTDTVKSQVVKNLKVYHKKDLELPDELL
ncbi:helix-turn-helix domain-containing protein [bacterium]|nr:helix-turn-helix domain-containing protein [bacterium]